MGHEHRDFRVGGGALRGEGVGEGKVGGQGEHAGEAAGMAQGRLERDRPALREPREDDPAGGDAGPVSSSTSASTVRCDARRSSGSETRVPPSSRRSYQARIVMPKLMETGRGGAWGKTNRVQSRTAPSSGTMGAKSWPSAPRPWSQMTAAVGARSRGSWMTGGVGHQVMS